jgi:hypothetical protein
MSRSFKLLVVASALLASCASAQTMDDPNVITRAEFKQLRWLEGTWRGTGIGQGPFYERYSFPNDTTLAIEHLDSTLSRVTETSHYVLANGKLANTNPRMKWQASAIAARSVTFTPVLGARNSFIWKYENVDSWTAILLWPETATSPKGERVYDMVRLR